MCIICAAAQPGPANPARPAPHGLSEAALSAGRAFLARRPSIDIHAHPGRFFMGGGAMSASFAARYGPPDVDGALADMAAGAVSAVMFATVADYVVLGTGTGRMTAERPFRPGEALADHDRQMTALADVAGRRGVRPGRTADDLRRAHADGMVACLFSIEGGDFIEDRLDRVGQAAAQGVRAITVIHYRVNQIGDTQTEQPVHGGLSPLGRDTIREMERVGILVDLAHASFAATADAAEAATRPMMISHSNIARAGQDHPRLITPEHARLVTAGGGIVGAVPAGIGQDGFGDYIDTIVAMVDLLGVEHVAIGTDMDFTFRPVLASYRDWPAIPAALLARGMAEDELALLMGGNFLRLMASTPAMELV